MEITSLTKSRAIRAIALTVILIAATTMQVLAQDDLIVIDWEQTFGGDALNTGQIIDDEYASGGEIGFSVTVDSPTGAAAIFDSNAPTGGDFDLGSPNETCDPAGPGVGDGGEVGSASENCMALNNVLIIADNTIDQDNDGFIDNPGDDESGGVVSLVFDEVVALDSVDVLDQEGDGLTVSIYSDVAGTNLIASELASALGDNSYERITLWSLNVRRVDFAFSGGGAIDSVNVKPMEATAVTLSGISAESDILAGATPVLASVSLTLMMMLGAVSIIAMRRRKA